MFLVSVIIPCFNQGSFLSEAVQSVVGQTYQTWECIIINDGSTDNTIEIAQNWVATDYRIKCLSKDNGGLSSARNEGLRLAKGTYVQFLDADDILETSKLLTQLQALKNSDQTVIAVCDHFPFDNNSREFTPRMYKSPFVNINDFKKEIITEWEFRRSIPCHNLLIPKKLIDRYSLSFNESLPNHEDWVFWCQLFYHAGGLCYQTEKLARYRMRFDSMTNNRISMAEGFLAATFLLETFYHKAGAKDFVSCVRKIRKEIKNNLFAHSQLHNYYAEMKQRLKQLVNLNNSAN